MAVAAAETRVFLEVRRRLQSALLILGKLLRVLPLPSENWSALVGEWCCHPDPFANRPLHPRENDCFIGDSFFLVNLKSDLEQEPKANTKVICKRCKVTLGETMSSETTKFYMTEVIIRPSEGSFPNIPRSQFLQSVIAQCLVELSSARSTFRFTIQGQDGKVYILLWVLNSDSLVIEPLRSSSCSRKFPLLESSLEAGSGSAWNAIKVLYQPCIKSRNKELASSWEGDISVHPLTLPSATCLELLLILSRNNASLPLSLRQMNSFQAIVKIQGSCASGFFSFICKVTVRKWGFIHFPLGPPWTLVRPCVLGGLFEDVTVEAAAFWSTSGQLSSSEPSPSQQFALLG